MACGKILILPHASKNIAVGMLFGVARSQIASRSLGGPGILPPAIWEGEKTSCAMSGREGGSESMPIAMFLSHVVRFAILPHEAGRWQASSSHKQPPSRFRASEHFALNYDYNYDYNYD